MSGSTSSGTMAKFAPRGSFDSILEFLSPDAYASTACPTYSASLLGAGEQTYNNCSFSGSEATWNGGRNRQSPRRQWHNPDRGVRSRRDHQYLWISLDPVQQQ
ncbi:MAG: hypothetical protein P4M08_01950 [Oligoflexia bacterium]|nr:hypothetical protein [Oligoflexia bacterium]